MPESIASKNGPKDHRGLLGSAVLRSLRAWPALVAGPAGAMRSLAEWQTRTRLALRLARVVVGIGVAWIGVSAEAGYLVDQQYKPDATFRGTGVQGEVIANNGAVGQTFTAGIDAIDFATFVVQTGSTTAGAMELQIRTSPTGALLGTSDVFSYPGGYGGGLFGVGAETEFDFTNPVALTVGSTYALVLVQLNPSSFDYVNVFVDGDAVGTYAGGSRFVEGQADAADLFFSEGIRTASANVPEPASIALLSGGLLAAVGSRRRREPRADRRTP